MSKKQKLFHCTVSFHGIGEATINNLTQEQAWQFQDVLRLIERKPPRYSESGVLSYHVTTESADKRPAATGSSGFLARLLWRLNAWMAGGALLLLIAFGPPGFAQRAVEPIRVSLVQEESPRGAGDEFFRRELNRLRDVAVVTKDPDYDLFIATMPITEGGQCSGFVAATLVIDRRTGRHKLTIHTGGSLEGIARGAIERIDRQFFTTRRK